MNWRSKITVITLLLVISFNEGYSQLFSTRNLWSRYRTELSIAIGSANYLGELGGRDQIGSDFLYDLEFGTTKTAFAFNYGYYLSRRWVVRVGYLQAKISGDDRLTAEPFRNNRNLSFQNTIEELHTLIEYHWVSERPGHRYNIRGVRGISARNLGVYVYTGIAGFRHNPLGQTSDGSWVELIPYKTEGQGLDGGAQAYSQYQIAIPLGIGFRYSINPRWVVSIDLSYRKTFTDYLDDVSTVYYDYGATAGIENGSKNLQQYLANPGGQVIPVWSDGVSYTYDPTKAGMQRGDPADKDAYLTAMFTVRHKLPSRKRRRRGGRGTRKRRASF